MKAPTDAGPPRVSSAPPRTLRIDAFEGKGVGVARGVLALLYSFGSSTRQGTMQAAATRPASTRPWVSLGRCPSSSAVAHMEVRARQARTYRAHRSPT
jgi:hypothetical protein